jgi:ABC-type antimicrobial peptide transport system permease subunit
VVTLIALLLSVIVVSQLASVADTLIEIPLSPEGLSHPDTILFMGILLVSVTLLAGFYPAFVISRFRPVVALKNLSLEFKGITLRKGLIASQFMVSQALIIGTIIVILQVRHFETKPLGFDKDDVLTTDLPVSDKSKLSVLRNSLLQYPEVKGVSFSLNTPSTTINKWWDSFEHPNFPGEKKSTELKIIDSLYIDLFKIEKLAGRLDFTPGAKDQIIVNEAFIKECGIQNPELAIGQKIKIWGQEATIIGVVKNFQTVTLHEGMHAVLLTPSSGPYLMKASLKIDSELSEQAVSHLEKHWKETFPNYYFTYAFLDDSLSTFYQEDRKVARLLGIFSIIAISIGCLGLFGLIMFAAVQRTKEVGIRKVLGATISDIITLLSKDFVILILIASACAWPVSYYLMNKWLEGFANSIRIADNLWIFGLSGLISLLLALITVGHQAIKSALTNPTDSLRTE